MNRLKSSSTNGRSLNSSNSVTSTSSKDSTCVPSLIQLCSHADEGFAYRTMRLLLSPKYNYSVNVYDGFGCNVLMYSLRYKRMRLFDFLLNHNSIDLNFQSKDRFGNTILHYAIIYGGNTTNILEKLIEKYLKFGLNLDERNYFGYTPLLLGKRDFVCLSRKINTHTHTLFLAVFCGRYDYVLTLLSKTDVSPFVRDTIQLKNMFDYLEFKSRPAQTSQYNKHLINQFYQTIPADEKTYRYKNFFEHFFLQTIQDQTNSYRSLINRTFQSESLTNLRIYLVKRYPKISLTKSTNRLPIGINTQNNTNSKVYVHEILNLFDPNLKPKAFVLPSITKPLIIQQKKPSLTLKKLSTKITTVSAFSNTNKKRSSLTSTTHIK